MGKLIDLTDQKFGKLIVIKRVENDKRGHSMWLCKCDCGNFSTVRGDCLINGTTKSCGCYQQEIKIKHNKNHTRLYKIFHKMKERCYNQNSISYKYYGARGITICKEWLNDFMNFYKWSIENGYNDKLTIDRIDNNKGYSPKNCRWTTVKQQNRNSRNCHFITYNNQIHCISEWAEIYNIPRYLLQSRIYSGKSLKEAISM